MLARDTQVTQHFQAWELGLDKPEATSVIIERMTKVANWLEAARIVLGNTPLVMGTRSGFRTQDENNTVGGSPTSSHLTGLAADFTPKGLTLYRAYNLLREAQVTGQLPPFDQIIYYAYDGHIHVGLGEQMRGEIRIQLREGGDYLLATESLLGYAQDAVAEVASTISALGGWVPVLALLLFVFVLVRT
jgi:hypothetical protein